ncbi:hypothetical protein [Acrocarpospora catenulata]|uniref:hypothetical protein n=1 Tax=Acrocarpospora catenulata TaxID=2836182 RepID=UPI001BD956E0|nr:hypothetical protein [Acrocarpospora catenulata]
MTAAPPPEGFSRLVRTEWTGFRAARGRMVGLAVAALLVILPGLLGAVVARVICEPGPCPAIPVGPDGQGVEDRFTFAHQSLTGDGGITVRLTSMTGIITYPPPDHDKIVSGLVPWAKAGIMIKENTRQGSAYAAVMLTGRHGVRMQHNFTEDTAGLPGGVSTGSPRWLRLTRTGETITGYESTDGEHWTTIGTATLPKLPPTIQIGLFAASPGDLTVDRTQPGGAIQVRFTQSTATFDHVTLQGTASPDGWTNDQVGDGPGQTDWERYHRANGVVESGDTLTVTGTGDIAPKLDGPRIETTLIGTIAGLIAIIILAARYTTTEYRREPTQVLAAKATVVGTAAFVAGLVAAIVVPVGTAILRANGNHVLPASLLTEVRVMAGTGALLAAAALLALGAGALLRRGVVAIVLAIVMLVLPYLFAFSGLLPEAVTDWLFRVTPAAGFAIQQSIPQYPQVVGYYAPSQGYFPLPPWAGLAVLGGYAALALGLAVFRQRQREA